MPIDTVKISIIVVTYKRDDLLARCLASIRANCGGEPQVVVVDNGNSDGTAALVAQHPGAVCVRSETNLGFAGGNNLGLPYCAGEFVLLLNNDTEIGADPLPAHFAYMDAHPEAAVTQGRMTLPTLGGVLEDCGTFLTPFGVQFHRFYRQPDRDDLASAAVFSAKGACMMFRRDIIAKTGGFLFHDHFGSYYEETDFCHRVWLAGAEVHFVPSPPVAHLCGATSSAFDNNAIWRQYYRNTLFSFLTLFGARGLWTVLPGYLALLAAQSLRNLSAGKFAAAAAPAKAIADTFRARRKIASFRREAQARRAVTDKQLFRRVIKRPRLSYYWYNAVNQPGKYVE